MYDMTDELPLPVRTGAVNHHHTLILHLHHHGQRERDQPLHIFFLQPTAAITRPSDRTVGRPPGPRFEHGMGGLLVLSLATGHYRPQHFLYILLINNYLLYSYAYGSPVLVFR